MQLTREIRNARAYYADQSDEWKETVEAALFLEQINRRLTAHKAIGVIIYTQQIMS